MNVKSVLAVVLASGNIMFAGAQQPDGSFFKEFTQGKVVLKNSQFAKGKFNYDCVNKEMHFLNGTTDMVVENLEDIDTVVVDKHRFIPFDGHFLEVLTGQKATLFVDWKVKPTNMGKKGAMGTTTHGSVQAIDVNMRYQRVNGEQNLDLSVYKMVTENIYYINMESGLKKFRNAKTLIALYPKDEQQTMKEFVEREKVDFGNPEEVLKVLNQFGMSGGASAKSGASE